MVTIREVETKRDLKKFVDFPVKLYSGNEYYVPALFGDEMNNFLPKKSPYLEDNIVKLFLAYKDDKLVGRTAGIISLMANEKYNKKTVRISRIDFIDDYEVSKALFDALIAFAKEQGMEDLQGPLGFNDLDKEGLLIEGFEELSTFETYYNYSYYKAHFEKYGFTKDADWLESLITIPKQLDERNERLCAAVMKRSGFREVTGLSKRQIIKRYGTEILDVNDAAFKDLYGTVPLNAKARKGIISQFKLVLDPDYLSIVLNKEGKVAAFALGLPSIAKAVQKSKGKLFPFGAFRILKSLKNRERIDLCLIGVLPEYQNSAITAVIFNNILLRVIKNGVKYAETNIQLETNYKIHQLFEAYDRRQHRRRRSFKLNIAEKKTPK